MIGWVGSVGNINHFPVTILMKLLTFPSLQNPINPIANALVVLVSSLVFHVSVLGLPIRQSSLPDNLVCKSVTKSLRKAHCCHCLSLSDWPHTIANGVYEFVSTASLGPRDTSGPCPVSRLQVLFPCHCRTPNFSFLCCFRLRGCPLGVVAAVAEIAMQSGATWLISVS